MPGMQADKSSLPALFGKGAIFLMEGALGERLKREYGLVIDGPVAMGDLLYQPGGKEALQSLWKGYLAIAERNGLPFLATTTTRRLNRQRMANTAYDDQIFLDQVQFLKQVLAQAAVPAYAGALLGCCGDAYTAEGCLETAEEAEAFHWWAASRFAKAGAQFLMAGLMPTLPEALGMAKAMARTGLPYLISFTVKKEGTLIDGTPIHEAIAAIDAQTAPNPLCYLSNCIHPTLLQQALEAPVNQTALVKKRFRGIQANTSMLEYDQLDGAKELMTTSPNQLAEAMAVFRDRFQIFGGCCGTDERHMAAIAERLVNR